MLGGLSGPPFMQVLPGVAWGTLMPDLVKVTEEDPGWKPELSGQQNQGGAADVQVASCRNPPLPAGDLDREAPVSIISLFIRGVHNPCIVFLLSDYFVFV